MWWTAGSVGGSSLLVFVRSLVHVLSWCPMSMCFPLFPHVSPLSWSFTERHRSVCQCLSLFPATERLGCVSRPDQLKDIREQLQALSSVDVLETWGSWGQRWTMLPHIGTRRHGHRLLGCDCAEVWAANFVEGHQAAAGSSDLMPWRVSRSESIREHQRASKYMGSTWDISTFATEAVHRWTNADLFSACNGSSLTRYSGWETRKKVPVLAAVQLAMIPVQVLIRLKSATDLLGSPDGEMLSKSSGTLTHIIFQHQIWTWAFFVYSKSVSWDVLWHESKQCGSLVWSCTIQAFACFCLKRPAVVVSLR